MSIIDVGANQVMTDFQIRLSCVMLLDNYLDYDNVLHHKMGLHKQKNAPFASVILPLRLKVILQSVHEQRNRF